MIFYGIWRLNFSLAHFDNIKMALHKSFSSPPLIPKQHWQMSFNHFHQPHLQIFRNLMTPFWMLHSRTIKNRAKKNWRKTSRSKCKGNFFYQQLIKKGQISTDEIFNKLKNWIVRNITNDIRYFAKNITQTKSFRRKENENVWKSPYTAYQEYKQGFIRFNWPLYVIDWLLMNTMVLIYLCLHFYHASIWFCVIAIVFGMFFLRC